jgi:hypothetical protein
VLVMARVTALVWVVHKRMAGRWVLVVLVFRRTRAAVAAVIGVVGLQATLHNLIAPVLVVIPVVVAAQVTPQQKLLLCCMLKA